MKVLVAQSSTSLQPCRLTVACQAPLSVKFSRQEYWSGLPFPSPGDLPNPGTEPGSPALQADSLPSEPQVTLYKQSYNLKIVTISHLPLQYLGFPFHFCLAL